MHYPAFWTIIRYYPLLSYSIIPLYIISALIPILRSPALMEDAYDAARSFVKHTCTAQTLQQGMPM